MKIAKLFLLVLLGSSSGSLAAESIRQLRGASNNATIVGSVDFDDLNDHGHRHLKSRGDSCSFWDGCGQGLKCINGKCYGVPRYLDEPCGPLHGCDSGLSCDPKQGFKCKPHRKVGEKCYAGAPCEDGLKCMLINPTKALSICAYDADRLKNLNYDNPSSYDTQQCNKLRIPDKSVTETEIFGTGGDAGFFYGRSWEYGHIYGSEGCFACYKTTCDNFEFGFGAGGYVYHGVSIEQVVCPGDKSCSDNQLKPCSSDNDCGGTCEPCYSADGESLEQSLGAGMFVNAASILSKSLSKSKDTVTDLDYGTGVAYGIGLDVSVGLGGK